MKEKAESKGKFNPKILLLFLIFSVFLTPLLLSVSFLVELDHQLFLQINSFYHPGAWDLVILSITQTGSLEFLLLLDIVLFVSGKRKLGTYLLFLLISYSIIGYGMKVFIYRPRPYLEYTDIFYFGLGFKGSFPSGHSLGAASFIGLLYARNNSFIGIYLPLAFMVFFSRIFLGMHYPLDVFAGIWIGLILGLLVGNLNLERIPDAFPIWKKRIDTD